MKKIFNKLHSSIKVLEPWGILLAALALLATTVQLRWDLDDRVQERTVRAWQLLTTPAPGNSGKIAALEYLNGEDGVFCLGWIKFATEWMFNGHHSDCYIVLKRREPLIGIDLSTVNDCNSVNSFPDESVFLAGVNLQFANLTGAKLNGISLIGAKLAQAIMFNSSLCYAKLIRADLSGALLIEANLSDAALDGANMTDTNLTDAVLVGADLTDADVSGADLSGAVLVGTRNLVSEQLDSACGNEFTILPEEGMSIKLCFETH
ncbi:MAG: pentapeptide repeat-containing protein [Gammaproteobacteria bacterium]|nr:pentapeptide repeat-containing protein [Gammaproteobacteria bacterium]